MKSVFFFFLTYKNFKHDLKSFGSDFRECWLLGSDKVRIGHAVTNELCSNYCLDHKMLLSHWMSMLLFITVLETKSCDDFFLSLTITMFERQFSFCGFFFPFPLSGV